MFAASFRAFVAIAVVLLGLAVTTATGYGRTCPNSNLPSDSANPLAVERATLCLLNAERTMRNLRPLTSSRWLRAAALYHSRDMVYRHYFAHQSPRWLARVARLRCGSPRYGCGVGENLAWVRSRHSTPKSIVEAWMRSPHHRQNVLYRPFSRVGVGIARGVPFYWGSTGTTYTIDFGTR